ncbi:MAG: DUF6526 family protein [Acidobacteriia bacterium]|nr:DUF6526 family protein [Terriglobia bacterium]
MANQQAQSFSNHRRYVPLYHYVLFAILVVNLGWTGVKFARRPSVDAAVALLVSCGLLILFFYARQFALTVQDRLIRLEMRLRLANVLPPELAARGTELSVGQLIALRFASDAELGDLVRTVLERRINERTAIKKMVRDWQADNLRA